MNRRIAVACMVVAVTLASGCIEEPHTVLGRLEDSRHLTAESLLQLAKVTEAGNRIVMADNPDAASIAAKDLGAATAEVARDTAALANELKALSYSDEAGLLEEFQKQFTVFRDVDREISDLAEQDTNLKAQRLSFGDAQSAADALRDALAVVVQRSPADDWHVRALTAEILSNVREIQALQAPHIAAPDDATMGRLEARIDGAQSAAQTTLAALVGVARPEAGAAVKEANAALERFRTVDAEIVKLSRQNSNVRALALALGRRRTLAAVCEEHLRSVQEELSKREIGPSR